jgi:TonB family protein
MANLNQSGIFYFQHQGVVALSEFPKDLRRNILSRIEPRFAIIFGGLLILATAIVLPLSQVKVAERTSEKDIAKIQERYAQLVLNQPKPKVEEKKEEKVVQREAAKEGEATGKEEVKVDRAKETFVEKQQRRQATAQERQQKREAIKQQVASAGIFAAITASSSGGGGVSSDVNDLLGATDAVSSLGSITVSKGTFATRKVDPASLTGPRGGQATDVGIQKSTVGRAAVGQLASAGSVNITSAPPQIKGDQAQVQTSQACINRVITREKTRIKRMYENWLKKDPQLAGNVTVRFTILPSGSVANAAIVKATTNSAEFEQNLIRYIQRWDFTACPSSSPLEIELPFSFSGAE